MSIPTQQFDRPVGWVLPVTVLVVTAAAIVTAFLGSGALGGTPIDEAAGGALSSDATPLAPAGPAFSIWSVIYLGIIGYTIWQLTPIARRSRREAQLRPWALASVVLNAAWIWSVQFDALALSVLVISVLLAVLIRIMYILGRPRTGGWVEAVVTDVTFGLYFGWVLVAAFANLYAWFSAAGVAAVETMTAGVIGFLVAAAVAILAAALSRGRIAPALATAWGLGWIAAARSGGQFESSILVANAAVSTVVVLAAPLVVRAIKRAR